MEQREIKFRAWDSINKKFITNYAESAMSNEWGNDAVAISLKGNAMEQCGGELYDITGLITFQQYTGLKDKNGKEIYEGDIIYDSRLCRKNGIKGLEVIFKEGSFMLYGDWDITEQDSEIIGNIHENPELV